MASKTTQQPTSETAEQVKADVKAQAAAARERMAAQEVSEEYVPDHVLDGGRDYRVEGNDVSGYIGVDPEYMTYASVGQKPMLTDMERFTYTNQYDHLVGNADEPNEDSDSEFLLS